MQERIAKKRVLRPLAEKRGQIARPHRRPCVGGLFCAWGQSPQLNIFRKFPLDFLDFSEVSELTEELICRGAGVQGCRGAGVQGCGGNEGIDARGSVWKRLSRISLSSSNSSLTCQDGRISGGRMPPATAWGWNPQLLAAGSAFMPGVSPRNLTFSTSFLLPGVSPRNLFPDQPLIYAALIIGMLVEFPHLTALKHLLLRQYPDSPSPVSLLPAF